MSESIKFFPPRDNQREKALHAVTITLTNPPSYDPLPTDQTCEDGKIHIYSCPLQKEALDCLIRVFENDDKEDLSEIETRLSEDIAEAVDTVLNFECCGSTNLSGFKTVDNDLVMKLVHNVLEMGGLVLFSDFSLKALIKTWKPEYWGPNPFINIGTCADYVKLCFDPKVLQQCPSGQLRVVGDLCAKRKEEKEEEEKDNVKIGVKALPSTIVYGLSPDAEKASEYSLQVLTIVTYAARSSPLADKDMYKAYKMGKNTGFLGHVLLTFRGGGQILTSAVHWKDLLDMDVSMDAMEKMLSKKDASDLKTKLDSCTSPEKKKDIIRSKYTSYVSRYSASRKGEYFTITSNDSKTTTENDSGSSRYSKVSAVTPCSTTKPYAKSHYSPGTILADSRTEKGKGRIEEPTTSSHRERRNIYVSGLALCDPK